MLKKVFVNGYGSIGSRIAQFIKDDPEIEVLGIGKHSPDYKVGDAVANGFSVFVPKSKENDFKDAFEKATKHLKSGNVFQYLSKIKST